MLQLFNWVCVLCRVQVASTCFPIMQTILWIFLSIFSISSISGLSFFGSLFPSTYCKITNEGHKSRYPKMYLLLKCKWFLVQIKTQRSWPPSFSCPNLRKTFIRGVHWIQHVSLGSHVFVLNLEWSKSMGGPVKANLRQTFTTFSIKSSKRDHSRQTDYPTRVGIERGVT